MSCIKWRPGGSAGRLLGNTRLCAGLALLFGWILWLHGTESHYEGWCQFLIELIRSCVLVWSTLFVLDACLDAALAQLHVC